MNFYGDNLRWFMGIVKDLKDPIKMGRVRVRIFGVHNDDQQEIPDDKLPWAQVMAPVTEGGVNNQGNVQTQMVDAITVSQNVLNVMEKEIENLSSLSMQKLYVDYLPDNLSVNLDGTVTSAKDYFKSIFGLVSY